MDTFTAEDAYALTIHAQDLNEGEQSELDALLHDIQTRAKFGERKIKFWQYHHSQKIVPALRARGFKVEFEYEEMNAKVCVSWEREERKCILSERLSVLEQSLVQLNANLQALWYAPSGPGYRQAHQEFSAQNQIKQHN